MKRKKAILEALILSSLMTLTIPGMAGAATTTSIGPVTVDGVATSVSTEGTTITVGKKGSSVSIAPNTSSNDTYGIYLDGSPTTTVLGNNIDSAGIRVRGKANLSIGSSDTDSVTVTGSEGKWGSIGIHGIMALPGSHVDVQAKNITISTKSTDEYAGVIWAQNNTGDETAPTDAASVSLTGDTISVTAPSLGIVNYSNGQVNINGDLTLTAPTVISARGYSKTNINTDGKHSTVINGNIEFETPAVPGDSHGSGSQINANVNLNLTGKDSSWTGRAYEIYEDKNETKEMEHLAGSDYVGHVSGLDLTMKDGATWNVTGNTIMDDLDADSSTINISPKLSIANGDVAKLNNTTVNFQGSNQKLYVNDLSGNGSTINTASLDNQLLIRGNNEATDLTVHGTGAIADSIAKDNSNAQKLANVAVMANKLDQSVASQITTDEGVLAGAYNLKVTNGKVDMAHSTYTPNVTNVGIASMVR